MNVEILGDNDVGVLVGEAQGLSSIINSYASGGTLHAFGNHGGGLVGTYRGGGLVREVSANDFVVVERAGIFNSYANVSVFADDFAGGLVGFLSSVDTYKALIANSYAAGSVYGVSQDANGHAGGLVGKTQDIPSPQDLFGEFSPRITNSYASGTINGNLGSGLVGFADTPDSSGSILSVSYSYAAGVNRSMNRLGLVRRVNTNLGVSHLSTYWDVNVSGIRNSGIADDDTNIRQTTKQLQRETSATGIYRIWSSDNWDFGNRRQYPRLKYASDCRNEDETTATALPICGTLLPDQYIGLRDLAFSSEVLQLTPALNPQIYDYQLILKTSATQFHTTPTYYTRTTYRLSVDDNEIGEFASGSRSPPIAVPANGTTKITLMNDRSDTTYTIVASRHPSLNLNDVDVDDDGLIEIRTRADLNAMRYQLNGSGYRATATSEKITAGCMIASICSGYELAADIDLSGSDWQPIGAVNPLFPASTLNCDDANSECFDAIFDGNRALGYEISGLTIASRNMNNIGLFSNLPASAEIRNLMLSAVTVTGNKDVGALIGRNLGASIVNVGASGEITGTEHVGGLIGDNDGLIEGSFADVVVMGLGSLETESHAVGGLVGYNTDNIYNSYASDAVSGERDVGGLVGDNDGRIINSYASGRVSGNNGIGGLVGSNAQLGEVLVSYTLGEVAGVADTGGLVGLNFGTLLNTYADGIVSAQNRVGGLVGGNRAGSIQNSYAIASVSDVPSSGGLVGDTASGAIVDSDSYWNTETSGLMQSAGGTAQTTARLQGPTGASGIYQDWDTTVWDFGTANDYPLLKYSLGDDPENPACGTGGQPACGDAQLHGLADLQVVGGVQFVGEFSSRQLRYRLNAYIGATGTLRLIPRAINPNAMITILYNREEINVSSGAVSDPIVLDPTVDDAIVVSVNTDGRILKYILEIDYSSFDGDRVLADADGDGLIEIRTLEDLDAMRYSLDGSAYVLTLPDNTLLAINAGCPTSPTIGCRGYELTRDLDFTDATSYQSGTVNTEWAENWDPIADANNPFDTVFNGNGYDIRHLSLRSSNGKGALGLFHTLGSNASVERLRLRNVTIHNIPTSTGVIDVNQGSLAGENRGRIFDVGVSGGSILASLTPSIPNNTPAAKIGGLVGFNNRGEISYSFAHAYTHSLFSDRSPNSQNIIGGLVGRVERGSIANSYAAGSVSGHCQVGGLVGNLGIATIRNSYTRVTVTRLNQPCTSSSEVLIPSFGGLVGLMNESLIVNSYAALRPSGNVSPLVGTVNISLVFDSYWDQTLNSRLSSVGSGRTTAEMQETTLSRVYTNWSTNDWDFGSNQQYPTLRTANRSRAAQIWDDSLLENLSINDVAITRINAITGDSSYRDGNRYRLYMDSSRLPLPITFLTSATDITLYCDDVRCPLTDTNTITLRDVALQLITMVVRTDNRIMEYYFDVVREDVRLNNVAAISLDEGDTFTVAGNYAGSSNINWSQTAGPTMTVADTDSLNLQLIPQVDLVPKDDTHSDVAFALTISVDDEGGNPQVYISREIAARINKVDNAPTSGDIRLTLNGDKITLAENLSDTDGNDISNAERQFQRRPLGGDWIDIDLTLDGSEYTVPAETIDYQYRLVAFYTDGQGYASGAIVSNVITVVASIVIPSEDSDGDSIINAEDIDADGDGLIEVRYLEDLDAIRYQLDGRGYRRSADDNLNTRGCPITRCFGYELVGNLSFDDASSYRSGSLNADWRVADGTFGGSSAGWQPIGRMFNATFDGNGYAIARMTISRSSGATLSNIGLFSEIGANGKVENLGLSNPGIKALSGVKNVGGIAGMERRGGVIRNSYVDTGSGAVDRPSIRTDRGSLGGLVGINEGYILNSYAKIDVRVQDSDGDINNNGNVTVGGLVGRNRNGGRIHTSYYAEGEEAAICSTDPTSAECVNTVSRVVGTCVVGGLVGSQETAAGSVDAISEIRNSYVQNGMLVQLRDTSCRAPYIAGLVGVHLNGRSIIANSYAKGRAYVPSIFSSTVQVAVAGLGNSVTVPRCDQGDPGGLTSTSSGDMQINIAGLLNYNPDTITVAPTNSYWRGNPYICSGDGTNFRYSVTRPNLVANRRLQNRLTSPTAPSASQTCSAATNTATAAATRSCTTYQNWNNDDWDFGTNTQYALLKYNDGAEVGDPACDFDAFTSLPRCGALLSGQPRTTPVVLRGAPVSDALPQEIIRYARNEDALAVLGSQDIITLNEGDTLRINASDSFSADNEALAYTWSQMSGFELLSTPITRQMFTLDVPDDLLPRASDNEQVVIRLELAKTNNRSVFVNRDVTINLVKTNSDGEIGAPYWVDDNTLFASDEISDDDGGPFTITGYQWQREVSGRVTDVLGATAATYTVPAEAIDEQYLLSVTYADGQGYSNVVVATAPLNAEARIVDADGDGLIDIFFIEQLNAIRHQPDGSAYKVDADAMPNSNGCPGSPAVCQGYELVRDLDFDDTGSYSDAATSISALGNWDPIDDFTAIFDGDGYTISNLNIATTETNAGLFGNAGGSAEIKKVRLAEVSISGANQTGALVGSFAGRRISDSQILGGTVASEFNGGCLAGVLSASSAVVDSSANCAMSATNNATGEAIGGLVGNSSGDIQSSSATSSVSGTDRVGGLVGDSSGNIQDSYATGDISGTNQVGGLVGDSSGSIQESYASGNVDGTEQVGGLVGDSDGRIEDSYASGNVSAAEQVGGLVGFASGGEISNSYAIGDVAGDSLLGGLVGDVRHSTGTNIVIVNSHASGRVEGSDGIAHGGLVGRTNQRTSVVNSYALGSVNSEGRQIGGLVGVLGEQNSTDTTIMTTATVIRNSYATTALTGGDQVGGLVGVTSGTTIISDSYAIGIVDGASGRGFVYTTSNDTRILRSHWDIERSGQSEGGPDDRGNDLRGFDSATLKSTELNTSATQAYFNWSGERWDVGTTGQYPALRYFDSTCDTDIPAANCGNILPRQRVGLEDLQLRLGGDLQQRLPLAGFTGARLKDDFDTVAIENYTVPVNSNIAEIQITAMTPQPDSTIAIDGMPRSSGSLIYTFVPDFSNPTIVRITTSEAYEVIGRENLDVEYRLTFITIPDVSEISRSVAEVEGGDALSEPVSIREGHFVTLSSELSNADGDDLSYQWTVDERQVRLVDRTATTGTVVGGSGTVSLSFYLRDDFISADQTAETVNAMLTVRTPQNLVESESLSLEVAKHNNGSISSISTPTLTERTYTAPTLSRAQLAEDPDGTGDTSDIRYQWQLQSNGVWTNIDGATAVSYTIGGAIGDFYRVIVSYIDGQGYRETLTSAPLAAPLEIAPAPETGGFTVLILAADGLSPDFSLAVENYQVPAETDRVTVTARTRSGQIFINGMPLSDEQNTIDVALGYGDNEIIAVWQGTDSMITQNYMIFRAYDVSLFSWGVAWRDDEGMTRRRDFLGSNLQPNPPLQVPMSADTATVFAGVNELINVTIDSPDAIMVGTITTSTQANLLIAQAAVSDLALGQNTIEFVLTAPDSSSASYTVQVWREYSSRLEDLTVDTVLRDTDGVATTFDRLITDYTVVIPNHQDSLSIGFERNEGATVVINGETLDDNAMRATVDNIGIGNSDILIEVSALREPNTVYTIDVTREYSLDVRRVTLEDAQMNAVTVTFDSERRVYTAEVPDTTTQITVIFATDLDIASSLDAATTLTPVATKIIDNNTPNDRIENTVSLALSFDENPIVIETSALGEQQATRLTITRLRSPNAELKELQLLHRNNDFLFSIVPTTLNLVVNVANNNNNVRLRFIPQNDNITDMILDGMPLDLSGLKARGYVTSGNFDLAVGENPVELKIIAHNGVSSQTYAITLQRAESSNASLDVFQVTPSIGRTRSYEVEPGRLSYALPVFTDEVDCVRLIPLAEDPDATIEISKDDITYLSNSCIDLSLGENTIEITVTAADRQTFLIYTITATRSLISDTRLSEVPMVVAPGIGEVAVSRAQSVDNAYRAILSSDVRVFSVTATAVHLNAMVTISGGDDADAEGRQTAGKRNIPISPEMPERIVTITVQAEDGTTEEYTLVVGYMLDSNTSLRSLEVLPAPGSVMLQDELDVYAVNVDAQTVHTTLTAVAHDPFATVRLSDENGNTIEDLADTGRIALGIITLDESGDSRVVAIRVTADDGALREYTLTVNRAESDNACLDALAIINADGTPLNDPDTNRDIGCDDTSQSFAISNSVEQVRIQATAENARAIIQISTPDNSAVEQLQSGENSQPIPVPNGGSVEARVTVISQNGAAMRTYTVTINSAESSDFDLRALRVVDTNGANLPTGFDPTSTTEVYRLTVPNTASRSNVIAEAHPQAQVALNIDGEEQTAIGTVSSELELSDAGVAEKVRIVVEAQDQSATRGYTLFVTRAEAVSTDTRLASIAVSLNNRDDANIPLLTLTSPDNEGGRVYSARIVGTMVREVQTVEQIRVSPLAYSSSATISIDEGVETSTPSKVVMLRAALDTPESPISVKVIAGDGVTSTTYTLLMTRVGSSNNRLASVTVGGVDIAEDSNARYSASVDRDTTNTTVTLSTEHSQAKVEIIVDGETISTTNTLSTRIATPDTGGSKTLPIVVIAQNGEPSDYSLVVRRAGSGNVSLQSVAVSGTEVMENDDGSYNATLDEDTMDATVSVVAGSESATVEIVGDGSLERNRGSLSRRITIAAPGASEILRIRVIAQSGVESRTYRLTVNRRLSNDARLYGLELLPQPLGDPIVLLDSASDTPEYSSILDSAVSALTVRPTASPYANRIEVFTPGSLTSEDIAVRGESSQIALPAGDTIVARIKVTAQDQQTSRTYSVMLMRRLPDPAELFDLSVLPGELNPPFTENVYNYEVVNTVLHDNIKLTARTKPGQSIVANEDTPLNDGEATQFALNYGINTINLLVESSDGQTTQRYTVSALRQLVLEHIDLLGLKPNSGYRFDPLQRSYDVTVAHGSPNLTVLPIAFERDETIEYTILEVGAALELATDGSVLIPFDVGQTRIITVALETEGSARDGYVVRATREANDRVKLSSFQVTPVVGDPRTYPVADNRLSYTLPAFGNEVHCIRLTPVAQNNNAIVEITKDGTAYASNQCIGLDTGENTIEITVTAADRSTFIVYTINASRILNSNTALQSPPQVVIGENQQAAVSRVRGTDNGYRAELNKSVSMFSVSAAAAHSSATVTILNEDNTVLSSGLVTAQTDVSISREMPERIITIVVQAQDGTPREYILNVNLMLSSNTDLGILQVGGVNLITQSNQGNNQNVYTANVPEPNIRLPVLPVNVFTTAFDTSARLTLSDENGDLLEVSDQFLSVTTSIAETGGSRVLTLTVTAEDGTIREYTLIINRAESDNACLNALAIRSADDTLLADDNTNRFIACNAVNQSYSISNSVTQVRIRALAQNAHAVIELNTLDDGEGEGESERKTEQLQSGESSQPITVPEGGSLRATVKVTSQNGEVSRTYNMTINRGASSDADLKALRLVGANNADLPTGFAPTRTDEIYNITVSNTTTRTRVIAEANPQAQVELDIAGAVQTTTGTAISELKLSDVGAAEKIRILVTSQDLSTTQGYTFFVTRAEVVATNANLASIAVSLNNSDDTNTPLLTLTSPDEEGGIVYSARIAGTMAREVQTIERVRISPLPYTRGAMISIDEDAQSSAPNKDIMLSAALDTPESPIPIKVTAPDGVTSVTYTLLITRVSSSLTDLDRITADNITLTAGRDQSYATNLDQRTTNTNVVIATRHSRAAVSITLDGETISATSVLSRRVVVADPGGSKDVPIKVTAQDGETSQSYVLRVTRDLSTDVSLASVIASDATVIDNGDGTYTANLSEHTTSSDVILTAGSEVATISVSVAEEGGRFESSRGRLNKRITIAVPGERRVLWIIVTAQSGAKRDYTLTVDRAISTDARLSSLELLPQPSGDPIAIPLNDARVYNFRFGDVSGVRVKPTAFPYAHKLEVFAPGSSVGEEIAYLGESAVIPLVAGETTTITIMVTAQDQRTTEVYIVSLSRDNTDAELANLFVLPGRLDPLFMPGIENYDAVERAGAILDSALRLTLTSKGQAQRVVANGRVINSNEPASFNLNYGENTLKVLVTAADGETTKVYTVNAFRPDRPRELRADRP